MTARSRLWLLDQIRERARSKVERLVEALELAVPARRVGRCRDVAGAELGEQALWLRERR
jgi:hypothetical protein